VTPLRPSHPGLIDGDHSPAATKLVENIAPEVSPCGVPVHADDGPLDCCVPVVGDGLTGIEDAPGDGVAASFNLHVPVPARVEAPSTPVVDAGKVRTA
jgi:hypothetical protein